MAKEKNKQCRGGQGSIKVKHTVIDGRSIAVMVEDETAAITENTDGLEEETEAASKNMGDEIPNSRPLDDESHNCPSGARQKSLENESPNCPPGVRQNAMVKAGNIQCETSAAGEVREADKAQKKSTYADLFSGNRMLSEESKLELFNQEEEEPAMIEMEDIQDSGFQWERCLVGYFGGRFPGKQALRQITNSWKVQVTVIHHGSGWLVFQFSSADDKANVLGNGPYIIYGRPLLLKAMPRLFRFRNEAISTFPVWIQLRYIPLDMWSPRIFGKICSGGEIYEQPIFYENLPRFCTIFIQCRLVKWRT